MPVSIPQALQTGKEIQHAHFGLAYFLPLWYKVRATTLFNGLVV